MRTARRRAGVWAAGLLTLAITGCGELAGPRPRAPAQPAPACAHPAPLAGTYDPAAPGYIVQYQAGVDPVSETSRLAAKYDFIPAHVYTAALHGFAATLTPDAVAGVRCEQSVASLEYNQVFHTN